MASAESKCEEPVARTVMMDNRRPPLVMDMSSELMRGRQFMRLVDHAQYRSASELCADLRKREPGNAILKQYAVVLDKLLVNGEESSEDDNSSDEQDESSEDEDSEIEDNKASESVGAAEGKGSHR